MTHEVPQPPDSAPGQQEDKNPDALYVYDAYAPGDGEDVGRECGVTADKSSAQRDLLIAMNALTEGGSYGTIRKAVIDGHGGYIYGAEVERITRDPATGALLTGCPA